MKIFLFAAILIALWVTKPIWMPRSNYQTTHTSEMDDFVNTQKEDRNTLLKAQDKELAALENKFGSKSSVMKILTRYFRQTYSPEDKFELLPCSPVRASDEGWTTVCAYRLKGAMRQDTYTVNNGIVTVN